MSSLATPRTAIVLGTLVFALNVAAIAVTGKPFILAAGADLSAIPRMSDRAQALAIARIGHAVFDRLHTAAVPTFVFVNGLALGGGFELALHAGHRTVSAAAAGLGVDRDAGAREGLEVAAGGGHRDLELACEIAGGHPAVLLQEQEGGHEPVRAHARRLPGKVLRR